MKLIGFTGQMGSGKSTAIATLGDVYCYGTINIKFAQPLYDMQEDIYKRISDVYRRPDGFVKDRKLLQWLGTDWGRSIDQNLWVNLWRAGVEETHRWNPDEIITCDDCRFDNEARAIKEMGGFVVRIISDKTRIEKINTGHASEAGVSDEYVDAIIDNSGDLENLRQSLLSLNNTLHIW